MSGSEESAGMAKRRRRRERRKEIKRSRKLARKRGHDEINDAAAPTLDEVDDATSPPPPTGVAPSAAVPEVERNGAKQETRGEPERKRAKVSRKKGKHGKEEKKAAAPVSAAPDADLPELPEGEDSAAGEQQEPAEHLWKVADEDHCETPREAYADIAPLLRRLAARLKVQPQHLKIYDPYYCAGGVVGHLRSLGFKTVINRCEDFYEVLNSGGIPDFDVIVTNPPYSADHIPRCLDFCLQSGMPWFALLPSFCFTKDYFVEMGLRPMYVAPRKRYIYKSPAALRPDMKGAGPRSKVSPYVSLWYLDLVSHTSSVVSSEVDRGTYAKGSVPEKADDSRPLLLWNSKQIPQRLRDQNDPGRKRLRKKQRDRLKRRAAAEEDEEEQKEGTSGASALEPSAPPAAGRAGGAFGAKGGSGASWQGKRVVFD